MLKPEASAITFGDDHPKNNPWTQDRLNVRRFSEHIASVVQRMDAPHGYVIGLCGKWGSGKSTVINFVISHIKKHNEEHPEGRIIHIDFRPWLISGHQDLIVAFFKLLAQQENFKPSKAKQAGKRVTEMISGSTDTIVDAAANLAIAIDPTGGLASKFLASVAKRSSKEATKRILQEPSIQAAYENLRTTLDSKVMKILITIDDLDRLENYEVQAVLRMVKSVGQLPNVIYLLSYDKEVVWEALKKDNHLKDQRFTEKIVQQEVELPIPTKTALLALLDEETSFLLASTPDSARWQYLIMHGIKRWIETPRDVVRLSNAVKFAWPMLEDELDPQDLITMEGLKLHDTEAYNWIRDNRDFLFSEGPFLFGDDKIKRAHVESLKKNLDPDQVGSVLPLLENLFPQLQKWISGSNLTAENSEERQKRRGISCEDGYDTYFALNPSSSTIPTAVIAKLVAQDCQEEHALALLNEFITQTDHTGMPLIVKLLDELRIRFRGREPAQPTQALLGALFAIGESILSLNAPHRMFELSPRAQIGFLIGNMLERWGIQNADEHLTKAFRQAESAAFMADVYVDRGRELGVFPSEGIGESLISAECFEGLGQILLAKIQAAKETKKLDRSPFFYDIARAWAHLDNPDIVREWLSTGIRQSAKFTYKVARGLVSYTIGGPVREYTLRDNIDKNLYDLDVINTATNYHLENNTLTDDERRLLTELGRGALAQLEGKSSEATRDKL